MGTRIQSKRHAQWLVRLPVFIAIAVLVMGGLLVSRVTVTFAEPLNAGPTATPTAKKTPTPAVKSATQSKASTPSIRLASALPSTTCALNAGTFTCDLYAMTGSINVAGNSVPIWGYATTSAGPATLPGPALIVTQGTAVNIVLHNVNLPSATSFALTEQTGIPDTTGITAGNSKTYSFGATALRPGTYLYEAGLTANGPRQVAMGLFGVLVVRPSACSNCAYDANSAFDDEALLVLSEIDPALNAAPATFNMPDYAPKYWLINGAAYPDVAAISTAPGHKVLLRYVNAGLMHHSMGLLGLHQLIVASDGNLKPNPNSIMAETIPTGETLDTIVTIPANAPTGSNYPLFEEAMHLDNNGILASPPATNPAYTPIVFGGMMTLVNVTAGSPPPTNNPPTTSNVTLSPNPTNGSAPVSVTAGVQANTGTVSAAEYFIDTVGSDGTGTAMSGTFGAVTVNVNGTISVAQLAALPSGNHTVYVHGQDSTGQWGTTASASLTVNKAGPTTSNVVATPNPANGSVPVSLSATAQAVTTGTTVSAAEYFTDTVGTNGTGVAMSGTFGSASTSVNATLSVAQLAGLSSGNHTFYVHAQDSLGNWGATASVVLNLDKTGPTTSNMKLTPSSTNGTMNLSLQATSSDVSTGGGNVVAAEYFIDPAGTPAGGSGAPFTISTPATDVSLSTTIISPTVAALAQGNHIVAVRGQDDRGNWGAFGTITLTVDKQGPTTSNVSTIPNPTNGTFGVQTGSLVGYFQVISATVTDSIAGGVNSNIQNAEYFIDTVTANGTGSVMIATDGAYNSPTENVYQALPLYAITALSQGAHTIYVHGQDAAGNWGPTITTTLVIDKTGPNVTINSLTPNPALGALSATLNATATDPANTGTPANGSASTIAAGEYFIGPDPGTGSGKPMNGTFNSPTVLMNVTIPISGTLGYNSYLLSARAKDAATNWGSVATRVFDVMPADGIFADGFESGNLTRWNGGVAGGANLTVTSGAAMGGSLSLLGLQATITGGASGYVVDTSPNNETRYHARFYFNPNGVTIGTTPHVIFTALSATNQTVFQVEFRRSGGQYQVRGVVSRSGGTTNTNWFNIPNSATAIEVAWQSVASSSTNNAFRLYTAGTLRQTLNSINTSAFTIKSVRLGPQGTLTGVSGTEYFDSFVSSRTTLIGQ